MSNPEDLNEHSVDEIYNHLIKDLDYNLNERLFPMDGISCITNTTMENVLNQLSSSQCRIDFDEERVKRIFDLAISVFDEFSKGNDSFWDIVNKELKKHNLDIGFDVFNKILWTYCSVRNFCEQFDKIYRTDGWEELCESIAPEFSLSWNGEGFCFRINDLSWKMNCYASQEVVKVISPSELSSDIPELYRSIRNAFAHGNFTFVYNTNWSVSIYFENNGFKALVDSTFFLSWMALESNCRSRNWNVMQLDNLDDIVKVVNDEKDIDELSVKYNRYTNRSQLTYSVSEIARWCIGREQMTQDLWNWDLFDQSNLLYLDDFQKNIFINYIKADKDYFNSLSDEDKKNYIYTLITYVYYWSVDSNSLSLSLMSFLAYLSNNRSLKLSDLNDEWWDNLEYKQSLVSGKSSYLSYMYIDDAARTFKLLYIKYFFTKKERLWTDNESKLRRHLRNCFIHGNYTHLLWKEIWFRDHKKHDWNRCTFLWNCDLDWLYDRISNWESLYDTEHFDISVF